jgi:hypothetical protein
MCLLLEPRPDANLTNLEPDGVAGTNLAGRR